LIVSTVTFHYPTDVNEVRIGTSGWSYPSGKGEWTGLFYPPVRRRPKNFDELAFYAEHFDTVEVNSTFYAQPRAAVASGWAERTPRSFEFSIKLYQKFTHPGMYRKRVAAALPPDDQDGGAVEALSRPSASDLDEFKRGIEPLATSGKLGVVLAQFPPSFKRSAHEIEYLTGLLRDLSDYRVAVELRHKSWSDRVAESLDILNGFGAAWVQIDEPKFRLSIRQNYLPNVRGFYYMRLHGRNAKNWWHHDKSEDRYDYLYSASELQEFTDVVSAARSLVKKTYLYTNNHFSAKSVVNAAMIKHELGEPIEGEYSQELVERYPEMRALVESGHVMKPAGRLL
jgi:uncharacterized protein YecE (DUF72 family)